MITKKLSRHVRNTIEARAIRMLRTLSLSATIRAEMQAHGYTPADHEEGWQLCLAVAGFGPPKQTVTTNEAAIRAAVQALEDFTVTDLPCFSAAVKRLHPEHYEALFGGLTLARGPDAMVEATLFLDRYAAFTGKHTKRGDHAVVALLERRGLTRHAVLLLREQVGIARSTPQAVGKPEGDQGAERDAQFAKLEAWVDDWTTTARRAIRRRDQQHRLGIGRRRVATSVVVTPAPMPALPAPVVTKPAEAITKAA